MPEKFDSKEKQTGYQQALDTFIEKLKQDRYILAAVLIGSLDEEVIWAKESITLWIIESDGVTRRRVSDGQDERVFRTLVEDDINIHAELIPRNRFKRMVEGSSRTAFSHSFFAKRTLLYSADESLVRWFESANQLATKDQRNELCIATTYVIHTLRHAEKLWSIKHDLNLAAQEIVFAAWNLAAIEIIRRGEVYEDEIIYKALAYRPDFFKCIYSDMLASPEPTDVEMALNTIRDELAKNGKENLQPVLDFLKSDSQIMPLSRLADHFAHSPLYPWHLESACEWLAQQSVIEKVAASYRLTTKSRVDVEEPAYLHL